MKAISEGKIIGIDTMVFIYHLENHPVYSRITERLFEGIEKAKYRAVTSFITLLEILVKPKRERALKAVSDYRDLLLTFPNLTFLPLELKVSDLASTLRAEYPIRTPDAIQIATAITGQASVFITNDEQLKKVDKINILLLRELTK
ncbi:MAG: type II toxin-antitoxin system VapC family toxin [bacterium]